MHLFKKKESGQPDDEKKKAAKKALEKAAADKEAKQVHEASIRKDQAQDARIVREQSLKALMADLSPGHRKLAKLVALYRNDGPEAITAAALKQDLTNAELDGMVNAAEMNPSGAKIMEGQVLKIVMRGKEPEKLKQYQAAMAGLNKKVNDAFHTSLETNPDNIKFH